MKKNKSYIIVRNDDVRCRCGVLAQAREHRELTTKQLRQPFYFSKWFNCLNQSCKTTIFMKDEYKVVNRGVRQSITPYSQLQEMEAQQSFWSKNL